MPDYVWRTADYEQALWVVVGAMCRTVYALLSTVICGIQMLVRVFMTFILMVENLFRMILQTCYNFTSFMLQLISLVPICIVFILSSRLKCFMCGGGGPCPVNRGGTCDCLMSIIAMVIVFFIFRATGVLDKLFYSIGYAKAPKEVFKFTPSPGDVTECSRNDSYYSSTEEEYQFYVYSSPEVPLHCDNNSDLFPNDDGGVLSSPPTKPTTVIRLTPKQNRLQKIKPTTSPKVTHCGERNALACTDDEMAKHCYSPNGKGGCNPCDDGYHPDIDDNRCKLCHDVDSEGKCQRCPAGKSRHANGECMSCGGLNQLVCGLLEPCAFRNEDGTCSKCNPKLGIHPDSSGTVCKMCTESDTGCKLCDSAEAPDKYGKCVPCGDVDQPPCNTNTKPCKYPDRQNPDTCLPCDDLVPHLHPHIDDGLCRICVNIEEDGYCTPCSQNGSTILNETGYCVEKKKCGDGFILNNRNVCIPIYRRMDNNDENQLDDIKDAADDDDIKVTTNDDGIKVATNDDGLNTTAKDTVFDNNQTSLLYYLL